MGVASSTKELVIATVNYSGILHSPFQFYSQESWRQQQKISQCFKQLLSQKAQSESVDLAKYKWGLGKIDQKLQKQRYTPIYRSTAGVQNKRLITQKQFRKRWQEQFAKAKLHINFQVTDDQIKNTQNFDLMCYRAFVYYLYGQKDLQKVIELNPQKYQQLMKRYFSKSFLNQKKKIELTFAAMEHEQVDIFLFQQSSKVFEDLLSHKQKFLFFKSQKGTSLIVLRKQKFRKIHNPHKTLSYLPAQFVKGLDWNDDTAYCMADNFIIISTHLSSKKQKNPDQIKKMVIDLQKLHQTYPMCDIIIGGDLNSFLDPKYGPKGFQVYPSFSETITTMKKRTWLQPQVNKADQTIRQCKDSLISTLPLVKPRVVSIKGQNYQKIKYIPNEQHPCDHFVVTANIVHKY